MIVVHHLNNSRSQRIPWLLEELGVPYRLEQHQRDGKTNLAPPELRAIHPLGKSPVIQDGDLTLAESGAIIEYLVERYGAGRLVPQRGSNEHVRYLYWMHFAEGTIMLHMVARLYLIRVGEAAKAMLARVEAMIGDELDLVEAELGRSAHLAGTEFSAADVQMVFPLEFAAYGGLLAERHVKLRDYLARMQARPAYRRAVEKGGAYAFDSVSAGDAAPFPLPAR
jgi:glutathione S-transferase